MKRTLLIITILVCLAVGIGSGASMYASAHQSSAHLSACVIEPGAAHCNGTNPDSSGCTVSQTLLEQDIKNERGQRIAHFDLYFSSICGTAWTRVFQLHRGWYVANASIQTDLSNVVRHGWTLGLLIKTGMLYAALNPDVVGCARFIPLHGGKAVKFCSNLLPVPGYTAPTPTPTP